MSLASASALTPERSRMLQAVMERLLPGTDGPGAAEAAVATAVEAAIGHRSSRGLRAGIEKALDRLQSQAETRYAREFPACAPADQDELLRALERDPSPWIRFVFRSLIALSLQGLLGDPVHGGNRECRGWESIGLRPEDARSGLCRGAPEA
ncbi:MAG: gluconate 2-dehydrogenase subunit 3 family protein [Vicinamibacterales bacterium]